MLSLKSDPELAQELAQRIKARRLDHGWSQVELAERAGIKLATYVFFERTGQISVLRLIKVFSVLGLAAEIEQLGSSDDFSGKTIDDLVVPKRQRGRRRTQP